MRDQRGGAVTTDEIADSVNKMLRELARREACRLASRVVAKAELAKKHGVRSTDVLVCDDGVAFVKVPKKVED